MAKRDPAVPRDARKRVRWSQVPGFAEWFVEQAPNLTNLELMRAIDAKWHLPISVTALGSLRRVYGTPLNQEALRRAYAARNSALTEKLHRDKPPLDPVQQMERDTLQSEVRRLSTKQTFFEMVGEKILRAIAEMPPVQVQAPAPSSRGALKEDEDMVLLLSDVQAGQVVDSKESGGLGSYSPAILVEEIRYLHGAIQRIRKHHPECTRVHVFWLGDIVEGVSIFPGQLRQVDFGVMQQVLFCVEHFTWFLARLAELFTQVKCYGVVGNHGRIGRPSEFSPLDNFDYLVYRWLEERLKPVKRVSWKISESWWQIVSVQGWRFLLVHGDDTGQSTWGIPFYGSARHKTRYRELFKWSEMPADFDFMTIGHHHEPAEFQGIFMNGSWSGSSEFSLKRLQLGGMPKQKLLGVHEKFGVTWMRDVNLKPYPSRAVRT